MQWYLALGARFPNMGRKKLVELGSQTFGVLMHGSEIVTRQASAEDVEAVARLFDLYRQFYAQPASLTLARAFVGDRIRKNESVIILAENAGSQILGFCQLYPTFCLVQAAPVFTLYDLFVAGSARKAGVGRRLLLAAESHAEQQGAARLDLTTAKTNLEAQSVYESTGWIRDDIFYAYSKYINASAMT